MKLFTRLFILLHGLLIYVSSKKNEEISLSYGDIGDEISTNYVVKKSDISIVKTDFENRLHHNQQSKRKFENTKIHVLNPFVHYTNPFFYRDFVALPQTGTRNQKVEYKRSSISKYITSNPKYRPMSTPEVMALNYINKRINPLGVHVKVTPKLKSVSEMKKTREKLLRVAKSLRSQPLRHHFDYKRKPLPNAHYEINHAFNPLMSNLKFNRVLAPWSSDKKQLRNIKRTLWSNINRDTSSKYKYLNSKFLKTKSQTVVNTPSNRAQRPALLKWNNGEQQPFSEDSFSERKRVWTPYNSTEETPIEVSQLSAKYKNNSLLSDLAKVRMTEPVAKAKTLSKSLLNDLSKVTMKWAGFPKSTYTKIPEWLTTLKHAIQPKVPLHHSRFNDKKSNDVFQATMLNNVHRIKKPLQNTFANNSLSHKKQLAVQQTISVSFGTPTQSTMATPVHTPYVAQPGVIPWNYYHSEYLPDGRIRTALYPISKHIPAGKCLPERSLCDKKHNEECCGASTFCVDYWGISQCVAFSKMGKADYHDAFQIRNNLNYKNYYKYLLTNVLG